MIITMLAVRTARTYPKTKILYLRRDGDIFMVYLDITR